MAARLRRAGYERRQFVHDLGHAGQRRSWVYPGHRSRGGRGCGNTAPFGWATEIRSGPEDEAGQALSFEIVSNTNTALFAIGPVLDPVSGDLTFTAADDAAGVAEITLGLTDDGGTENGGTATSLEQTFTIIVNSVPDVAALFVLPSGPAVLENVPGAFVGELSILDPDPGDTHFIQVSDARFEVIDGRLYLKPDQALDEESEPTVEVFERD